MPVVVVVVLQMLPVMEDWEDLAVAQMACERQEFQFLRLLTQVAAAVVQELEMQHQVVMVEAVWSYCVTVYHKL
jgi:hypothetical protein